MSELKVLTEIEQVKEHIAITDEEIFHAKTQLKIKNKRLKDLENKCGLRVK